MRLWKVLGLAAAAGVLAAGVVVAERKRRAWKAYDPDEVRDRLHERFARLQTADGATEATGPAATPAP